MNDTRLREMFRAAQKESAPEPPFAFSRSVVASIQREQREVSATSIFDLLNQLFPKVAIASFAIVAVCFASDLLITERDSNLSTNFGQITEQWLFAVN